MISLSHTLYHAIQSYKCLKIKMLNKIEHSSTHYNFKRFLTLNYIILVETPYEKNICLFCVLKYLILISGVEKRTLFPMISSFSAILLAE